MLAAHRDTYFRRLRGVRPGDDVLVTTLDGIFAYRVDSTLIVPPDRTDLLAPARGRAMTLVTCYPFHWIGPAPDRFLVCASLVRAGPRPVSGRSAVRANLSREARPTLGM